MDWSTFRSTADNLIDFFSNGQAAVLMKGEKVKDPKTGKIVKVFREVEGGRAVMVNYSEETIAASDGVIGAGDVKFICNFSELPTDVEDRIRYAGQEYNVVHCKQINPQGDYVVTYVIQGRKA
jgi:hypothetical protein